MCIIEDIKDYERINFVASIYSTVDGSISIAIKMFSSKLSQFYTFEKEIEFINNIISLVAKSPE